MSNRPKRPRCRVCGKFMKDYSFYINGKQQAYQIAVFKCKAGGSFGYFRYFRRRSWSGHWEELDIVFDNSSSHNKGE